MNWLRVLASDTVSAARTLRRGLVPSLGVSIITALAVGVLTTTFLVGRGVLLKPFNWPQPERLVQATELRRGNEARIPGTISNATYHAWRESPQAVQDIGAWRMVAEPSTIGGADQLMRVNVVSVTAELFRVLEMQPALGEWFTISRSERPEIILSDGLWRTGFGGDRSIVGKQLFVDSVAHDVAGVMPADFAFPDRHVDAWVRWSVPTLLDPKGNRRLTIVGAIARLHSGATVAAAASEATARAEGAPDVGETAMALFGQRWPILIRLTPIVDALAPDVGQALKLITIAASGLFVIAIINLAAVQSARALGRADLHVKHLLGSSPHRLVMEVFIENILLAISGGVIGLWLATMASQLAANILPAEFPRVEAIVMDQGGVAFAVLSAIFAGILFSIGPLIMAWQTTTQGGVIAAEGKGAAVYTSSRRVTMARSALLSAQTAAAFVLVVYAAALFKSYVEIDQTDRGYVREGVLAARVTFPRRTLPADRIAAVESIVSSLRQVAGVEKVGFGNALPLLSSGGLQTLSMDATNKPGARSDLQVMTRVVSAGYFSALGLKVLAGRPILESDVVGSSRALVVNRTFAESVLGSRPTDVTIPLRMQGEADGWRVVGVVEDMRQSDVTAPRQAEVFISYQQLEWAKLRVADPILVLRVGSKPEPFVPVLQSIVRQLAPEAAVDSAMSMDARVRNSLGRPRMYAYVVATLAGVGVAIAAAGLFAVSAHLVSRRSRELAMRVALGASRLDIISAVLRSALTVATIGIMAGWLIVLSFSSSLAALLPGAVPSYATNISVAALTVLFTVALASAWPLWRALGRDIVRTLSVR